MDGNNEYWQRGGGKNGNWEKKIRDSQRVSDWNGEATEVKRPENGNNKKWALESPLKHKKILIALW